MRISHEGLALIRHFEGFAERPYRCAAGHWTIGYGHVIQPREAFIIIDEQAASFLLQTDARIAEAGVRKLIKAPLEQCQFDALVSFTFNLGGDALQRSTLRRAVNRGDEDAAEQFQRWVYAGGRKLPGLIRRRRAEAQLFRGLLPV